MFKIIIGGRLPLNQTTSQITDQEKTLSIAPWDKEDPLENLGRYLNLEDAQHNAEISAGRSALRLDDAFLRTGQPGQHDHPEGLVMGS